MIQNRLTFALCLLASACVGAAVASYAQESALKQLTAKVNDEEGCWIDDVAGIPNIFRMVTLTPCKGFDPALGECFVMNEPADRLQRLLALAADPGKAPHRLPGIEAKKGN